MPASMLAFLVYKLECIYFLFVEYRHTGEMAMCSDVRLSKGHCFEMASWGSSLQWRYDGRCYCSSRPARATRRRWWVVTRRLWVDRRTHARTLAHARTHDRAHARTHARTHAHTQVSFEPCKGGVCNTEPGWETMEENRVIYGVEGSRKVEKAEAGDLLMAYCCNEVVM